MKTELAGRMTRPARKPRPLPYAYVAPDLPAIISPMTSTRTQVGIVGAGPAGLLLGHLLHLEGIDSVIIERRSQEYVIERVRAGVLEQGTTELMTEAGLGDRMRREGLRHGGIWLAFSGRRHQIDFAGLTGR